MLRIKFFGQLTDFTGCSEYIIDQAIDTKELKQILHLKFPSLAHTPYRLAVDMDLPLDNIPLSENHIIALLPPYAGG